MDTEFLPLQVALAGEYSFERGSAAQSLQRQYDIVIEFTQCYSAHGPPSSK
jgi:hypothetical protein